jgi:hypothetical protein
MKSGKTEFKLMVLHFHWMSILHTTNHGAMCWRRTKAANASGYSPDFFKEGPPALAGHAGSVAVQVPFET